MDDIIFKAVVASLVGSTLFMVALVVGHWFYLTEKKGDL